MVSMLLKTPMVEPTTKALTLKLSRKRSRNSKSELVNAPSPM